MVSLQAESTPWFHYEQEVPDTNEYVPTYAITTCPSYECNMQLLLPTTGDPFIEYEIKRHLQNSFVSQYCMSAFRYQKDDYYTLFLPIHSPLMTEYITILDKKGYSFENRYHRTEASIQRDQLLESHMCSYQILPEQIENKNTRVQMKNGYITIDSNGWITRQSRILYWKTVPCVTLFFITNEIENDSGIATGQYSLFQLS